MALNKEYFDSINIDVVKKKYYNANKVNAVFEDIRLQAEALMAENELLRTSAGSKDDIADAILSARIIAQKIVQEANEEANAILAAAEKQREELLRDAQAKQEYATKRVERCFNSMRAHQLACMEALNSEWQEYLCGLDDAVIAEEEEENVPADLKNKVSALADSVFSLDDFEF